MNDAVLRKVIWLLLFSCFSASTVSAEEIVVCSFNIQFLGFTIDRDDQGLANLLRDEACDLVAVQELVAPPSEKYLSRSALQNFPLFPADAHYLLNLKSKKKLSPLGTLRVYPPGPEFQSVQDALDALLFNPGIVRFDPIIPEPKATEFFDAMEKAGFTDFALSDEDTGPNKHHSNTTASEWWLVFFNPKKVEIARDLPYGFLDRIRANSDLYERVPFAFPFRSLNKKIDFVVIPVHLPPDGPRRVQRKNEFDAIDKWVSEQSAKEKDFIILGDFNIQNKSELEFLSPRKDEKTKWKSLNDTGLPTNTFPQRAKAKPYDHAFYNPDYTTEKELSRNANFKAISLVEKMKYRWAMTNATEPYPGGRMAAGGRWIQYDHTKFRTRYSDHNPIRFVITLPEQDDD